MMHINKFFMYLHTGYIALLYFVTALSLFILMALNIFTASELTYYNILNSILLLWLYSVGIKIHERIPTIFERRTMLVFQTIALIFFIFQLENLGGLELIDKKIHTALSIISINVLMIMVSKSIVKAEAVLFKRYDNCIGVYLYITVFPIGYFHIQPRISLIIDGSKKNNGAGP
jgi:hypothetical protein